MTTGSSDAPHACAGAHPDSVGAANCRSGRYLIARAQLRCSHCARIAPVVGLMLPAGHETLVDSGNSDAQHWVAVSCPALLFFVEQFPERVGRRLQQFLTALLARPGRRSGAALLDEPLRELRMSALRYGALLRTRRRLRTALRGGRGGVGEDLPGAGF